MVFIEEITETMYEKAVRLKGEGNDAFKQRKNSKAKNLYSQALQILEEDGKADEDGKAAPPMKATLLSNRCQVELALNELDAASEDAKAAVAVAPSWPKAHHRLGSVHMRAGEYVLAFDSYQRAAQLDPEDVELTKACAKAHEAMAEHGLLPDDPKPTGAPVEEEELEPKAQAAAAAQPIEPVSGELQMQQSSAAEEPQAVSTPRYEVALTEASSNDAGVAECVVTVWLPLVESMKQLDVEISSRELYLKAAELYELRVDLPQPCVDTQATARFSGKGTRKGTFTMRVPLLSTRD